RASTTRRSRCTFEQSRSERRRWVRIIQTLPAVSKTWRTYCRVRASTTRRSRCTFEQSRSERRRWVR
ncbi:unnamed protein product, partial [Ectocarpus sp. 12 AP-2014]